MNQRNNLVRLLTLLVVLCGLAFFTAGEFANVLKALASRESLSTSQLALFGLTTFIGSLGVGVTLWALGKRVNWKATVAIAVTAKVLASLTIGFTQFFPILLACRVVQGGAMIG